MHRDPSNRVGVLSDLDYLLLRRGQAADWRDLDNRNPRHRVPSWVQIPQREPLLRRLLARLASRGTVREPAASSEAAGPGSLFRRARLSGGG